MRGVSQISPPIRIVLVLAVAVLAAWMLFLRPSDEVVPEPPAPAAPNTQTSEPAVSAPGKAAEAAQGAVEASNEQLQAQESVDGVDAGESAAGTATGSATPSEVAAAKAIPADLKGVPTKVAKAIGKQKVLVLLFWNRASADDRAVRSELRDVDRWDGRVHVQAAPIRTISRYGRITRGADVEQSPSVVVVDPELRAETLVGFVDTATIDQAVVDALRNSTGLFTSSYLREVNAVCAKYANQLWSVPTPQSGDAGQYTDRAAGRWGRFSSSFKGVKTPKKWRAFRRAAVRDHAAAGAVMADWSAFLGSKPSTSRAAAAEKRFGPRLDAIGARYDRRMDAEHVLSCGSSA
jgi:hypothetical protein